MPSYPFDMQLVVDPYNTSNVVANGQIFIYDPSDTGNASPLVLTDPNGLPLTNPLMSNSNGFIPAFIASVPQVKWTGASFTGYFDSYVGLRDEAVAAVAAAEAALAPAQAAVAAAADSAALAQEAADSAAAAAAASGGSNIALDTDGVPYFFA